MKKEAFAFCLATSVSTFVYADGNPDEMTPWEEEEQVTVPTRVASDVASKPGTPRVFDMYASDKAAQFMLERDSGFINVEDGRASVALVLSEKRDVVLTGGVVLDAEPEYLPGVRLSFGGKVYAAMLGVENADTIGFAMGVEAAFDPEIEKLPVKLDAYYYYAPDIFTFGDTDRVFDWQVNMSLPLREGIDGYIGVRYLKFDTNPNDRETDRQVHVGVRWLL